MRSFKSFLSELYYKPTKPWWGTFDGLPMTHSDSEEHEEKIKRLHEKLSKGYNIEDHRDDWDAPHYIKRHTNGSYNVNAHLHHLHTNGFPPGYMSTDMVSNNIQKINGLDAALKGHKAPTGFHVYTGLAQHPLAMEKVPFDKLNSVKDVHTSSAVIRAHLPAFTSTSINPRIARKFSGENNVLNPETKRWNFHRHMLKIMIPAGSEHGAYVGHVSTHGDEHEFLMRRAANINIHPVPEVVHEDDNRKIFIWHAHVEGHDDDKPIS